MFHLHVRVTRGQNAKTTGEKDVEEQIRLGRDIERIENTDHQSENEDEKMLLIDNEQFFGILHGWFAFDR